MRLKKLATLSVPFEELSHFGHESPSALPRGEVENFGRCLTSCALSADGAAVSVVRISWTGSKSKPEFFVESSTAEKN